MLEAHIINMQTYSIQGIIADIYSSKSPQNPFLQHDKETLLLSQGFRFILYNSKNDKEEYVSEK